jgi:hypothetical protein
MRRLAKIAAPLFFFFFWSAASSAQQPSDQEAMAAAQFERGLAAMNEGNYDLGCPALTESVRLDPRAGAIFTLAECEARWGHVASADAHYDDYLARFARMTAEQQRQQRGRDKIAEQKRAELRSQIPQLQLRLPAGAVGAVVKRDGVVLGPPSLGVFLPVDPGAHILVVETTDGGRSEQTVHLEAASRRDVLLEVPVAVPSVAPPMPRRDDVPPAESTTPWLAYSALGLGVLGLGVGVGGGIIALSQKSTVDQHCSGTVCDHDGKSAADSAKGAAVVSTIGFAVGGVALTTGVVMLLVRRAPSAISWRTRLPLPRLDFDARGASIGAKGTF